MFQTKLSLWGNSCQELILLYKIIHYFYIEYILKIVDTQYTLCLQLLYIKYVVMSTY